MIDIYQSNRCAYEILLHLYNSKDIYSYANTLYKLILLLFKEKVLISAYILIYITYSSSISTINFFLQMITSLLITIDRWLINLPALYTTFTAFD